jgi:hypothetical protein
MEKNIFFNKQQLIKFDLPMNKRVINILNFIGLKVRSDSPQRFQPVSKEELCECITSTVNNLRTFRSAFKHYQGMASEGKLTVARKKHYQNLADQYKVLIDRETKELNTLNLFVDKLMKGTCTGQA